MEWGDIRVFLGVARAGQMAGATRTLGLEQSTISRRIVRLEEKMGVSLFERAGRRLSLTSEGSKLLAAAERLESIIIRDVMSLRESNREISGRVRIGTSVGFGAHYLAARLPLLGEMFPGLEIELVALPRTFSLGMRDVDIAIVMDRPETGDVRFKKLSSYVLAAYAQCDYFNSKKRPLVIEDLRDHRWCGYINELLYTTELDMMTFGDVVITPDLRTTEVTAQLEAVRSGAVMGILPCYMADIDPSLEMILPDLVRLERTYWMVVHSDLAESPRVRTVWQEIERWVHMDRALFIPERPRD